MAPIVAGVIVLALSVALLIWLGKNQDKTTLEEVEKATFALTTALHEAEEIVGKLAPHNADCRRLLDEARRCLAFNAQSTRMVVNLGMIKRRREQGVLSATRAAEIAKSAAVRN